MEGGGRGPGLLYSGSWGSLGFAWEPAARLSLSSISPFPFLPRFFGSSCPSSSSLCSSGHLRTVRTTDCWADLAGHAGCSRNDRWGFPQEVLAGHGVRVEGPWGFSCGAGLRVHSGSLWWELFSWHCPRCSCASLGDTARIPGLLCDCWGQQPGVVPTATY